MGKINKFKLVGLGIQNFRIFRNYKYFNIKPITIITGTNNAGKSTLGRAILLLSNAWENNKFGALFLESEKEVLGTFESNLPYNAVDDTIVFKLFIALDDQRYELELHYRSNRLSYFNVLNDKSIIAKCKYKYDLNFSIEGYTESFIKLDDDILNIKLLKYHLSIEDNDLLDRVVKCILEELQHNTNLHFSIYPYAFNLKQKNPIVNLFEGFCENIKNEDFEVKLKIGSFLSDDLSEFFKPEDLNANIFQFINKGYNPENQLPKGFLEYAMFDINNYYQESNLNTIIYRKSDYPKLYNSLSYFSKNDIFNTNVQSLLYHWVVKVMKLVSPSDVIIDVDNLQFIKVIDAGEWGDIIKVKILSANQWVDLSTLGYGASNLILKFLQLVRNNKLTLIEEPEANLHPSLQSKLADVIVYTSDLKHKEPNTFGIPDSILVGRRIIETHSEYFIRRLQYLVANEGSSLSSEDIQIYYFNNPLEEEFDEENQIIDIKINHNGTLTNNFGKGFMDEADNIALELYLLQYK